MTKFTATHGVEFGEQAAPKKDGTPGTYVVWAKFEHDRALDTADGVKVYVFSTDDEAIAERVRAVTDYGITEVETPAEVPPETPVDPAS
jgi:hypothetical protein